MNRRGVVGVLLAGACIVGACGADRGDLAATGSTSTPAVAEGPTITVTVPTTPAPDTTAAPPTTAPAPTIPPRRDTTTTAAPATVDGRTPLPWHEEGAFPALANPPQSEIEVDAAGCVRIGAELGRPTTALWPRGWSAVLDGPVRIFDETGTQVWGDGQPRHVVHFGSEDRRFLDRLPAACRDDRVLVVGGVGEPL